jgi:hypothetical protein
MRPNSIARLLTAVLFLAASLTAHAQCALPSTPALTVTTNSPVVASWVAPTTNVDSSAITAALTYNVYALSETIKPGTCTQTALATGLTALSWRANYAASQCIAVTAVENGVESARSPAVCVAVVAPPPVPNPPSGLSVTVPTAYVPNAVNDTISVAAVGAVPVGTSCDATQGVVAAGVTYNVVPLNAVKLNHGVTAPTVVARCS